VLLEDRLYSSRRISAARGNGARSRGAATNEGLAWDTLAQSPTLGLTQTCPHLMFQLSASPSPPAVVDLVAAPNSGIPNEPSPVSEHRRNARWLHEPGGSVGFLRKAPLACGIGHLVNALFRRFPPIAFASLLNFTIRVGFSDSFFLRWRLNWYSATGV